MKRNDSACGHESGAVGLNPARLTIKGITSDGGSGKPHYNDYSPWNNLGDSPLASASLQFESELLSQSSSTSPKHIPLL